MRIQFLGAARQVTGSCTLLEAGGLRLLVDCGMFQEREFQARNWEAFPVPPESIDYLLLTHAHLDHSGLIPKLVRDGFRKPILTTLASRDLAEIILKDAAHIQEEDAAYKKKRHQREGRRGPHPEVPLYRRRDAAATMPLFRKVDYGAAVALNDHLSVTFHDAGHILGSAMLEITVREDGRERTIAFSGDLGQRDKPIVHDPSTLSRGDYLVMESTYGGRDHVDSGSIEDQLEQVIQSTMAAGGNILIPTFAVERAQELMVYLGTLVRTKRIPPLMAFLDSPMAANVTRIFRRHENLMDHDAARMLRAHGDLFDFPRMQFVRSTKESKAINRIRGSCMILAGSGMCTAGRIKHHLVNNIHRPESTIVFVGYQAHGTLGRQIVEGQTPVRILGKEYEVRARIAQIHGLSAHADQRQLLDWLGAFTRPPRRVFLNHGEPDAAEALAKRIQAESDSEVTLPRFRESFSFDS